MPIILQMDNGKEFKGVVIVLLRDFAIAIRNGRPYHPPSQGVVENGNKSFKNRVAARRIEYDSDGFVLFSYEAVDSINRTYHTSLRCTPYEAMFGTKAFRTDRLLFAPSAQEEADAIEAMTDEKFANREGVDLSGYDFDFDATLEEDEEEGREETVVGPAEEDYVDEEEFEGFGEEAGESLRPFAVKILTDSLGPSAVQNDGYMANEPSSIDPADSGDGMSSVEGDVETNGDGEVCSDG